MEDLARIVMAMFVAWIVSGLALAASVWLAPLTWSKPARMVPVVVAGTAFTVLTGVLFGIGMGAATALPVALLMFYAAKRG